MVTLRVKNKFRPWLLSDITPSITVQGGGGTFMPGLREALIRQQRGTLTGEELISLKKGVKYALFNCTCGVLTECLDKLTGNTCFGIRTCKRGELITNLINGFFNGERCAICMGARVQVNLTRADYEGVVVPKNWCCKYECEQEFIVEYLIPFGETPHRMRAQWYKGLVGKNIKLLEILNYVRNYPRCGLHHSHKACLLHSIDYNRLDHALRHGDNRKKLRIKRFRETNTPFVDIPKDMLKFMLDKINGTNCIGVQCNNSLLTHVYTAVPVHDLDAQCCSAACWEKVQFLRKDWGNLSYHDIKRDLVFQSLKELFKLRIDKLANNTIQDSKASSVWEELVTEYDKEQGHAQSYGEVFGSSAILSFNMQGEGSAGKNNSKVRNFLKSRKPAVIALQEIRTKPGKNHPLSRTQGYSWYSENSDTALMVRKDMDILGSGTVQGVTIPHTRVKIKGNSNQLDIICVYARDGELSTDDLIQLNKVQGAIVLGDFNAKHQEILPHSQSTSNNTNGRVLHKFLNGMDNTGASIGTRPWTLMNPAEEGVYTHSSARGGWVQIDLIFAAPELAGINMAFEFFDDLTSDHRAVGLSLDEELHKLYVPKGPKRVTDWKTFNAQKYKDTLDLEVEALKKNEKWKNTTTEGKVILLTNVMQRVTQISVKSKLQGNSIKPLPIGIKTKIKERKHLNRKIKQLAVAKLKIAKSVNDLMYPVPNKQSNAEFPLPPDKIIKETALLGEKRTRVNRLNKEIERDMANWRNRSWNSALTKLANTDPDRASKEFWSKIKKLSGGRGSNAVSTIEYKGKVARSPEMVADLMGEYMEDSFQPLQEDSFNYEYFARIEQETELGFNILETNERVVGEFTNNNQDSSYLNTAQLGEEGDLTVQANPTEHQHREWGVPRSSNYKKIKVPLPQAPKGEIRITSDWRPIIDEDHDKVEGILSMVELDVVIHKMKHKAPGHDGLYIDSYKHMGPLAKQTLLDLYNNIYEGGTFPIMWKHAILAPLLKKDKSGRKPESYRPISLLPVGGKILEGIILARMTEYLESKKLIPSFQTGFRKGMGTSLNLKRLYNHVYLQSARAGAKRPTVAVLFDAKKAFDSVWHEGLLHKCMRDNLPPRLILFLRSWLHNRTLQVRIGDKLSKRVLLRSGVPQGALPSPLLWNYYIGDCPSPEKTSSDNSLYADDTGLWTTHTTVQKTLDEVQSEIFRLTAWTRLKRIKFEPTKTAVLACHRDKKVRDKLKGQQLYLDQEKTEKLQWVPHAKFLGITFSENCTFHEHWRVMMSKCKSRINVLWRFKGKIPGKTLYRVYKAAIEPLLTYGSEVLFETLSDVVTKRLLSIEFQAIRLAYNLGMRAPIAECLPFINNSIVSVIDKRRDKFIARNLGNPLIRHTESLRFSEGRKLRVWKNYTDKSAPGGYMRQFYLHKDVFFFSGSSYGDIPQLEGCAEGQIKNVVNRTPENERRFDGQRLPKIRVRPAHKNDGLEDAEIPSSGTVLHQREVILVDDEEEDSGLIHDHGYSSAILQRVGGPVEGTPNRLESQEDSDTFHDHNYFSHRARANRIRSPEVQNYNHNDQVEGRVTRELRLTQGTRAPAPQGDARLQDGAVG